MPTAWLLLLLALGEGRLAHRETIASLVTSRHTHVEVEGHVTVVRHEADGDWHVRLSDGHRFIVAEIIPTLVPPEGPILPPKPGDCVRIRGIRRVDTEAGHGWIEVHPVEFLEVIPCNAWHP